MKTRAVLGAVGLTGAFSIGAFVGLTSPSGASDETTCERVSSKARLIKHEPGPGHRKVLWQFVTATTDKCGDDYDTNIYSRDLSLSPAVLPDVIVTCTPYPEPICS